MTSPRAVVPGEEELGIQRRCPRCGESFPEDAEFFAKGGGRNGLHSWCIACWHEYSAGRRRAAGKPVRQVAPP